MEPFGGVWVGWGGPSLPKECNSPAKSLAQEPINTKSHGLTMMMMMMMMV